MKKTNKLKIDTGITLIALVITIIILLILAGVSIASLTESGLFEKAKEAKQKSENAQAKENAILKDYESTLNEYLSGTGGSSSDAGSSDIEDDEPETIKYFIKYEANSATSGNMENSEHEYDVAGNLTANVYERIGYTFIGWNTEQNGSGTSYEDKQSIVNLTNENGATIILYAQWEKMAKLYLYNQGDVCESLTGGWRGTNVSSIYTASGTEFSLESDCMYMKNVSGASYAMATVNKVLIPSEYTKIYISIKSVNAASNRIMIGYSDEEFPNRTSTMAYDETQVLDTSEYTTLSVDITGSTGVSKYWYVKDDNPVTGCYVNAVWFE